MHSRASDEGPSTSVHPAAEDDDGGMNKPKRLQQRESRIRRSLLRRGQVDSTAALVLAYNAETDAVERNALLEWLNGYVTLFEQQPVEGLKRDGVLEYAELANVKPFDEDAKKMLRDVLFTMGGFVFQRKFKAKRVAEAMRRFLERVDPKIFDGTAQLVELTDMMLSTLGGGPPITKETLAIDGEPLLAIHQIIVLLQTMANQRVSSETKRRFKKTLAAQKREMADSLRYYPVRFRFMLIEQGILRLPEDASATWFAKTLRVLGPCCCGLLYFWHGVRNLITLDIDSSAIEAGLRRWEDVISSYTIVEEQWYDAYLALKTAKVHALRNPEKAEVFEKGCEIVLACQHRIRDKDHLKALRFGLIEELRVVAIEGPSADMRTHATRKLSSLGSNIAPSEGWIADADVFEALLDAVYAIHATGEQRLETAEILEKLASNADFPHTAKVMEWLGGESLGNKLAKLELMTSSSAPSRLLREVRKMVRVSGTLQEMQENVHDLKLTYLDPAFICVPNMFENDREHNIDGMKFEIVLYEEVDSMGGSMEDHAFAHYRRKVKTRTPIPLEDLFKRRALKGEPISEIRRLLLVGNPGTGKTCISKAIAHKWAKGDLWPEFDALYLLPVRELNALKADETSGMKMTLTKAIATTCFPAKEERDHTCFLMQIAEDLERPSTLLILDGLDEGNKSSSAFINLAWGHQCKVLCLSRPYDLQGVRKRVDLEMECIGLNDAQLEDFIESEFGEVFRVRVIQTLKDSAAIWEIAHVPINAQIICTLFRDQDESLFEANNIIGLSSLYSKMVMFMWKRYIKKSEFERLLEMMSLRP